MSFITKIQNLFKGKKTYIIGILMIILGAMQGDNQLILEGLGFLTVRAGISNIK